VDSFHLISTICKDREKSTWHVFDICVCVFVVSVPMCVLVRPGVCTCMIASIHMHLNRLHMSNCMGIEGFLGGRRGGGFHTNACTYVFVNLHIYVGADR